MSFAVETEKLTEQLIQAEYKNACEQFGDKFHSLHEGYAVLLEEYEEMENEIQHTNILPQIWDYIKLNREQIILEYIKEGEKSVFYAMKELAQVGAVLMKIRNTLEVVE